MEIYLLNCNKYYYCTIRQIKQIDVIGQIRFNICFFIDLYINFEDKNFLQLTKDINISLSNDDHIEDYSICRMWSLVHQLILFVIA